MWGVSVPECITDGDVLFLFSTIFQVKIKNDTSSAQVYWFTDFKFTAFLFTVKMFLQQHKIQGRTSRTHSQVLQ